MPANTPPRRVWRHAEADEACAAAIAAGTGLSPVVARILAARGVCSAEAAQTFLTPSLARDWRDPDAAPRDARAPPRPWRTRCGRGSASSCSATSTSTASRRPPSPRSVCARSAATSTPIVPHRFREGYGLTAASVERLLAMSPELVVTVDCGIAAADEVAALRARGHRRGRDRPSRAGRARARRACRCATRSSAATRSPSSPARASRSSSCRRSGGAARRGRTRGCELIDLATLGTVADIVPLLDENRALVAEGLARAALGARVPVSPRSPPSPASDIGHARPPTTSRSRSRRG